MCVYVCMSVRARMCVTQVSLDAIKYGCSLRDARHTINIHTPHTHTHTHTTHTHTHTGTHLGVDVEGEEEGTAAHRAQSPGPRGQRGGQSLLLAVWEGEGGAPAHVGACRGRPLHTCCTREGARGTHTTGVSFDGISGLTAAHVGACGAVHFVHAARGRAREMHTQGGSVVHC